MAFVATPNAAKLVLVWGHGAERWTNNLWFSQPGFVTDDMRELVEHPFTAATSGFMSNISEWWYLLEAYCYDMREEYAPVVQATHEAIIGENVDDRLPQSLSVVQTLRTNYRGRMGRGRLYMAGWTEAGLDNGAWTSTITGAVATFLGSIRNSASFGGWTWGVRTAGTTEGWILGPMVLPITYTEVRDPRPGVIRKRVDRG